jgi:cation:H+ antiporter
LVWLKLVICILVILFSGQKVAKYGDVISERTGMGRVWMGVIAIAAITSLPELFTGISAVTLVKEPDLTVGDLIGANAFNLLNLAMLDLYHRHGSIFLAVSPAHRVTAWFSLLLLAVVGVSIFVSRTISPMSIGWIGWYTPVIIALYIVSVRQVFYYEKKHPPPAQPPIYPVDRPLGKLFVYFGISALFIIGAGIWLAIIGSEIAAVTGWQQSFVGSLFLAFTTTLPEITVSFTAIRIGATDMAVANMVGSNLFNLAIIPVTDIIYSRGPVLADVSINQLVLVGTVAIMTLLLIYGLRARPARHFRLSWLNLGLIVLFLAGMYLSFIMGLNS